MISGKIYIEIWQRNVNINGGSRMGTDNTKKGIL